MFLGNKIHTGLSLTESTGGLGTGFSGGGDFFLEQKISLLKTLFKTRTTIYKLFSSFTIPQCGQETMLNKFNYNICCWSTCSWDQFKLAQIQTMVSISQSLDKAKQKMDTEKV